MNTLTKWLKALYDDCPFSIRFNPLEKEYYQRKWAELLESLEDPIVPEFFVDGVDLGHILGELSTNYIEATIENAGYKQTHTYILTGITCRNDRVSLYFSGEYSNWAPKRIVTMTYDGGTIIRNDFKDIYLLSWKDYNEGKYQKAKGGRAPKLKRGTLTLS